MHSGTGDRPWFRTAELPRAHCTEARTLQGLHLSKRPHGEVQGEGLKNPKPTTGKLHTRKGKKLHTRKGEGTEKYRLAVTEQSRGWRVQHREDSNTVTAVRGACWALCKVYACLTPMLNTQNEHKIILNANYN